MTLSEKIYLAPFQGITTYTYREVYTKYFGGVDKIYTPFFTGNQKPNSETKKAFEFNFVRQNNIEVVPQILSKDANEIIAFANFCKKKGYNEINWNLGCPYPRVANKKRGSGMLPYPKMVEEILKTTIPEIDINFSVKCRLGYFNDNEILDIISIFNSFKIYELTIHARVGKQLYKGNVRLEATKKASLMSNSDVVYNGDVFSTKDFEKLRDKLLLSKWMIGRGVLVDPFLPMKIKNSCAYNLMEQKEIAYKFITDIYLAYRKKRNNKSQAIGPVKELWSFMSYSFNNPQKVFNSIKKTRSFDEYEEVVAYVFKNYRWVGSDAELFHFNNSQK